MPRASVIIPTWNGADLLRAALLSLRTQRYQDFEVVVVDNGSVDHTVSMLESEFADVIVVRVAQNRGFAPAVNLGLARASGEILVLMNNDVEAEPGWLAALVAALDHRPEVGSVASKMLDARRPGLIDAAGDRMSLVAWNHGRGEPDGPAFAVGREILSACAGAAAYRRRVFEEVGTFDERYFAWFEDVDLGVRAQLAGFRCWYEPSAVVRHHGSATGGRVSDMKVFYTYRNAMLLFLKTMPLRRLVAWGPAVLLWPWVAPLVAGVPLRVTARASLSFVSLLPHALRARRAIYRDRTAQVPALMALLDSPLDDFARAFRLAWGRVQGRTAPVAGTRGAAA